MASVGLERMLSARDERAARQAVALARFSRPLVSMTVVTPGPVKDGSRPRRLLAVAMDAVEGLSARAEWRVLARDAYWLETGPEALYAVDADARLLKSATVGLEDRHTLGRLWDLDVIEPELGGLSRQALGWPPRRCLICEQPAHACARSRRHPLDELSKATKEIVDAYDRRFDGP